MNKKEMIREVRETGALPEVLTAYLLRLPERLQATFSEPLHIQLVPGRLGGRWVQDVLVSKGNNQERFRVFGFLPVSADLVVVQEHDGCPVLLPEAYGGRLLYGA